MTILEDVVRHLAIFLGEDARFDIAVGGNPYAVDKMLAEARAALDRARSKPPEAA